MLLYTKNVLYSQLNNKPETFLKCVSFIVQYAFIDSENYILKSRLNHLPGLAKSGDLTSWCMQVNFCVGSFPGGILSTKSRAK